MYELEVLIAALGQIKKPNMFLWNLLVRATKIRDKRKFEVHTKSARRVMAPFVGKYSGGEFFAKDGFTVSEFEPGKIMPKTVAHADELLQQQFGQTQYGNFISPEDRAIDAITDEIEELDTAITRTENWMLSKLMTTGVMPIVGKTVKRAITFGEINKETLSGTSCWNKTESDPIDLIKKKQLEVLKETGILVDSIVLGTAAATAFQNHAKVTEKLKYTSADVLRINPRGLGDGAKFLGTIPELNVDIYTFVDWVIEPDTKKEVSLFPEKGMLGVKSKSIVVNYGAIPQMNENKTNVVAMGSRIPKTWVDDENDSKYLRLGAAPLPVPDDAKGWFYVDVLE